MENEIQRKQFTFYRSFYEALSTLPDNERLSVYDAVAGFALNGTEPELSGIASTVFILIRPTLQTGRNKAASGQDGGESGRGKPKKKQTKSKTKANEKQNEIYAEEATDNHSESKIEKEIEIEVEIKKDIENKTENDNISTVAEQELDTYSVKAKYKPTWFERFYDLYPKKVGKAVAAMEWDKLHPNDSLCKVMSQALEQHKRSRQWQEQKMIPNLDRWIREKRWTDKLEEAQLDRNRIRTDEEYLADKDFFGDD